MMTLNKLNTVFDFAVSRSIQTNREDLPPWAHRGAGIRAVVEALRDEIVNKNSRCGWCLIDGALDHVSDTINEILASDGLDGAGDPSQPRIVSAVGVGVRVKPPEGEQ
jgi:hypothetical protein